MTGFRIDPAFVDGSVPLTSLELCDVRLQDDARFPWLILLPRVPGAVEIEDLDVVDRGRLMAEAVQSGIAVRAMGLALDRPVEKLNLAALGNVTPQLHVHVIGRRRDDPAWPSPIWGVGVAQRYDADRLERVRAAALDTLR